MSTSANAPAPILSAALRGALARAIESAGKATAEDGRRHFVSLCAPLAGVDALTAFAAFEGQARFYWEQPTRRLALAARGVVEDVQERGPGRFTQSAARIAGCFARLQVVGEDTAPGAGPRFVGGFAFGDAPEAVAGPSEWGGFPDGRMVLPELMLAAGPQGAWLCATRTVDPAADTEAELRAFEARVIEARELEGMDWQSESGAEECVSSESGEGAEYRVVADRAHAAYRAGVAAALEQILDAELEKVVLARSLRVEHPGRFALPGFLGRLREIHPSCTIFAVAGLASGSGAAADESLLVAASPERLVALEGERVVTGALAGSSPRGRTPEHDAELGRALCESKKDLHEHEAVVRAIHEALAPVCDRLVGPARPDLMRVEGIMHLFTPLEGRLAEPPGSDHPAPGVLDLVARLHPTPAVGGLPRPAALTWLADHEGLDRGWYAGPVGVVDRHGGGEFWLALRSGLIHNPTGAGGVARARLFAGAGIVHGSLPEHELRETRLKLRALLAPLTEI
jgi:isochorismate synthase